MLPRFFVVSTRIQHKLNQVPFYLNNIINITKNKSNITTNVWFFVIDITTLLFNLNFIEGKAPDISNVSKIIVTNI